MKKKKQARTNKQTSLRDGHARYYRTLLAAGRGGRTQHTFAFGKKTHLHTAAMGKERNDQIKIKEKKVRIFERQTGFGAWNGSLRMA